MRRHASGSRRRGRGGGARDGGSTSAGNGSVGTVRTCLIVGVVLVVAGTMWMRAAPANRPRLRDSPSPRVPSPRAPQPFSPPPPFVEGDTRVGAGTDRASLSGSTLLRLPARSGLPAGHTPYVTTAGSEPGTASLVPVPEPRVVHKTPVEPVVVPAASENVADSSGATGADVGAADESPVDASASEAASLEDEPEATPDESGDSQAEESEAGESAGEGEGEAEAEADSGGVDGDGDGESAGDAPDPVVEEEASAGGERKAGAVDVEVTLDTLPKRVESPVPLPNTKLLDSAQFAEALHRVSVDHTVVICAGNEGFLAMLTNFIITSVQRWEIRNFLAVALTPGMCAKLPAGTACFEMPDATTGGSYGSKAFARLVNVKTEVTMAAVALGYNTLLVDGDIVFLKNPLPRLQGDYDLHIQVRTRAVWRCGLPPLTCLPSPPPHPLSIHTLSPPPHPSITRRMTTRAGATVAS